MEIKQVDYGVERHLFFGVCLVVLIHCSFIYSAQGLPCAMGDHHGK
jgi:hypothetical protein